MLINFRVYCNTHHPPAFDHAPVFYSGPLDSFLSNLVLDMRIFANPHTLYGFTNSLEFGSVAVTIFKIVTTSDRAKESRLNSL